MEECELRAIGLLSAAREHAGAADALNRLSESAAKADHFRFYWTRLYLYETSIELALKSVLSSYGFSEKQLKSISHNIPKACQYADDRGFHISDELKSGVLCVKNNELHLARAIPYQPLEISDIQGPWRRSEVVRELLLVVDQHLHAKGILKKPRSP